MQKNKKILIPLIIVVIALWGIITYKIIDYFMSVDKPEIIMIGADEDDFIKRNNGSFNIEYVKLTRDPFSLRTERSIDTTTVVQKVPVQKPLFNFRIQGIIFNQKQKILIIEDLGDNSIINLKEGEKYKDLKVLKIHTTSAEVLFNKEKKTLELL